MLAARIRVGCYQQVLHNDSLFLPDEGPDVWLVSSLMASESSAASERLATVRVLAHIGSLSSMGSPVASQ